MNNNMIDGFDHAMIAVRDLDDAARRYRAVGFAVTQGGRHPGRGTENVLMRFGWGWLELITVRDPGERSRLRLAVDGISTLLRDREGGFVDVILETHATRQVIERLSTAGIAIHEFSTNRLRPDGLSTKNCGFALAAGSTRHLYPSFIEWQQADPERLSPERQPVHPNGAQEIVATSIIVNDLNEARRAYADVLELPVERVQPVPEIGASRMRCRVGSLTIDLLAASGPGLVQSALAAIGEGLFEVHIRVKDVAQSLAKLREMGIAPEPAPGVPGGWLLPEKNTCGARIVLER